jgi:murein DD-endopeptidase MepM/ murein hydrolase activator NlpD
MVAVWLDGVPEGDPAYADIRFKASWLKTPVKANEWNGKRVALIQATTSVNPNTYSVRALQIPKSADGKDLPAVEIPGTRVLIRIADRKFGQQVFSVSKELEAVRSADNLNTDAQKVAKAKANGSTVPIWEEAFIIPIPGEEAQSFGKQRIINGVLNYTHSGVDVSGTEGTPIHAPAAGIVVFSGPLIASGNTVILDHGLGMYSSLVHMSKTAAVVGTRVKQGDIVGYVGATGFATGPHLHWTLTIRGNIVDPEYLMNHDPLAAIR